MSTIQAQMKTVLNDFDKCCVTAIYTQFLPHVELSLINQSIKLHL